MFTLPGYQISPFPIHEGAKTLIYRVYREHDKSAAIVKTLKAEYPTLEEITRLRHEYKILQSLDLEGIVKARSLENHKNGLALILEDFDGESLKDLIVSQKIPLLSFLSIAIQLSSILSELHQNNIIHKDIKPHNILIDPKKWSVKIIDFSISTRLARETTTLGNPNLLEGTLAYMSPEQTGRMNRSIDYRTDLYSLGVTFYEILTDQLPFQSTDPMQLVHCHIAKKPITPHQLNPEIPEAISDIVMKLLAKTAEERYQSTLGLKADLETCLDRLLATGKIENFTPGHIDKSGQFLIPQKLYGREAEVTQLLEAFERVTDNSQSKIPNPKSQIELILVSGYSGIGKTSVVNEVHKPIVGARGYFIAGKFDQFKRNIPYAALIQAFQELMRHLLTEKSAKLAIWKEKILDALGQNGQVIIDVIPEVEKIIGTQPDVPQMGPSESQNRFNRVFQKFIQIFTKPEHPLVIFMDDLQWADSASLKLIQNIMTDSDLKYLLMIGAYRDNEVSPTHPTIQTIEKIQQAGTVVNNIVIHPLDLNHVSELIADTLGVSLTMPSPSSSQALSRKNGIFTLAELLFNKTQGNPFFLTQLLQTLASEKLLTFDFNEGRWLWNIEQIQGCGIQDYNVVELVARNIKKLSDEAISILKLAACIGNQFNLDVLAIVNQKSLVDTANDLWEALQTGLILPLNNAYKIPLAVSDKQSVFTGFEQLNTDSQQPTISYKFIHDRVQQAAYSLIPDDQKKATHLKIGQLLWQKTAKYALEENIFDIVNQLNIGVELVTQQPEKDELAKLNLTAGKKAKSATAIEAAVKYLNVALELLRESSWESDYEFTLNLYVETVEAEYLNTNYESGAALSEIVLHKAKTLLEKVPVYETKILFYISQNKLQEAIDTALQVLKMLGVTLSPKPSPLNIIAELIHTKLTLGRKRIEDLSYLPEMTDSDKLAAMRILKTVAAPAFIANPAIGLLVILTMVRLSIKYGNSPIAAFAYVFYGMILCGAMGDIESGYKFGQLALNLLERFNANSLKAKVISMLNGYIIPWKNHARETIEPLPEAIQSGLETGDIEYAGYSATTYCLAVFWTGEHLEIVDRTYGQYISLMQKLKQEFLIFYKKIWRQAVLNLQGLSSDKCLLIGESFNEAEMLPSLIDAKNYTSLFAVYLAKLMLFYLFKDYSQAVESGELAAKYVQSAGGMMLPAEYNFYYSLALLARYPHASKKEQRQALKQVGLHQKKMKKWAFHAPYNFEHKYLLVEAEKARVLGKDVKATDYYEKAIAKAKAQGYIQEEALANELAAEFNFCLGREKIAQTYLTEAYYGYIRWGAESKVKDLSARYPDIFDRLLARENPDIDVTRTTTYTTGGNATALDLATVMKASQAISSEIVLDQLLDKLMQIAIENAGARKGILFLRSQADPGNEAGKFVLVAEGCVEKGKVLVLPSVPIDERPDLPVSVINYVERTGETVVLNNATVEGIFTTDTYILRTQPKSILCMPILQQGKLRGILYLENNLTAGAFTQQRLEVLKLLVAQASISLQNAGFYEELQSYSSQLEKQNVALQKSEVREKEKAQQLEQSLYKLQQTQAQLVQTEKISSLGQLVAGVAHEVNNPVGFIAGNLQHATNYAEDLFNHLRLYEKHYQNPPAEILQNAENIDLEYLMEDLPSLLRSMKVGTDRIREIMQSLRNFSRVDESEKKLVDIHSGLDSTLMILHHRLKAKAERSPIELVKEYGDLPLVECYVGQLNQVFMNLLANAIDAIEQDCGEACTLHIPRTPSIRIRTEVIDGNRVAIRIKDNGPGMTKEVLSRLFDPFFTTKPVGKGTGLGLSISYQIVVEKHGGELKCISAPGQGAEFVIAIRTSLAKEIPVRQESQQHLMGKKSDLA
ncbi:trifunctional serine/threonine-protein kinase/ATP-binding protein/sensor histidine kinase [Argonema antarcticum]|uniref:trifunctional serine/threonine-protein kinase/ATP-binding protein/sensor histidine kinase n=1 Tax=Argonema antarcticum TaxID=2942763 RepID=UPI0020133F62|nr:ATP-binding sensor histidine kinase [Argonema antarcticum]MCL1473877.1 AAA family ATPase [Argonema antarcticum A004/B2]